MNKKKNLPRNPYRADSSLYFYMLVSCTKEFISAKMETIHQREKESKLEKEAKE